MAKLEWNTHRKDMRKALLVDAIGGGLCDKHGEYLGHGQYGLKDCPFCDIEVHFERERLTEFQCKNCSGKVEYRKSSGWGHIVATGCIKPAVSMADWKRFQKSRLSV